MSNEAKLIGTVGTFEVYKFKGVVIINDGGEHYCNLRRTDRGYFDPIAHCEEILNSRQEYEDDKAAQRSSFRKALAAARDERDRKVAAQGAFAF